MFSIRCYAGQLQCALLLILFPAMCAFGQQAKSGLDKTVLVGYQGWFRCPGDGAPANAWSHWSRGIPAPETMVVDLYPDTSELNAASRCPIHGETIGGRPAFLFSSFSKETVEKHFEWMRTYEIDGALVQRFVNSIAPAHKEGDTVLRNVRAGAEANGRVFAIEYDLSGAHPDTVLKQLQDDWAYMNTELKVTQSPAYLHDNGKPVVAIWGLGFKEANHLQDPAVALQIVEWFKNSAHATVVGGVPSGWGTMNGDSASDPGWKAVYKAIDVIQPWTVGRYKTLAQADDWKATHLSPDLALTAKNGQRYMPVIFPGFSWYNLRRDSAKNAIPRLGGRFLWKQAYNAKAAGAQFVKIAMFDEVNEGTAIFKAAPLRTDAPDQGYWLTLDADGEYLPSDWYLRIATEISRVFHGTAPLTVNIPSVPHPVSQAKP
jgi:hypothetical protein